MFVTAYVYWIVSPTLTAFWSAAGVTVAVLSTDTAGLGSDEVETVAGGEVALPPCRSVPVAVAVSVTPPLSTSAWVTTYGVVSVHVSVSPGASPGGGGVGHVTAPPSDPTPTAKTGRRFRCWSAHTSS